MRNPLHDKATPALRTSHPNLLKSLNTQSWHASCIYIGVQLEKSTEDPMTNFAELAIISMAFGMSIGYTIGIIKHLADLGWRLDSMEWF